MNSPPSRFRPGSVTPLQVLVVAQTAVWRSSSFNTDRRTSPDDIRRGHSRRSSLRSVLAVVKLVLRCAELAGSNPLLTHPSFAEEPEYRYDHSPPPLATSL